MHNCKLNHTISKKSLVQSKAETSFEKSVVSSSKIGFVVVDIGYVDLSPIHIYVFTLEYLHLKSDIQEVMV